MEEKNTQIQENQSAEISKKPISKKTIIIAAIVAAVLIIAAVVCILAFGKSAEEKAIIGEWYCDDWNGMSLKFFDDSTAELSYGGRIVDMEWRYDEEKENYRANAGGERITFTMCNEEGVTFLDDSGNFGYWFREDDRSLVQEKGAALRNNIINKKLQDKLMITLGEAFSTESATIVFNRVVLNDAKTAVVCDITVTAKKNLTAEDLNNLIDHDRNICFESGAIITSRGATGRGKMIATENALPAGESMNFSFDLLVDSDDIEKWGIYHGYSVFEIEGTEYRLDLREYTKQ